MEKILGNDCVPGKLSRYKNGTSISQGNQELGQLREHVGDWESESKWDALTIVPEYIPVSRGVNQNIPRVGKTRQHLERKLADTLKRVEDITDIRDKSE